MDCKGKFRSFVTGLVSEGMQRTVSVDVKPLFAFGRDCSRLDSKMTLFSANSIERVSFSVSSLIVPSMVSDSSTSQQREKQKHFIQRGFCNLTLTIGIFMTFPVMVKVINDPIWPCAKSCAKIGLRHFFLEWRT